MRYKELVKFGKILQGKIWLLDDMKKVIFPYHTSHCALIKI